MRILKIESLPLKSESWVDKDEIMLHACFQLLKDCVEHEHVDVHANYKTHKHQIDEVRFLYDWWKKRSAMERSFENEEEDNKMLIRLMKIRTFLWT